MSGDPVAPLVVPQSCDPELMEMYLEAEAQFSGDYFWFKHGHEAFLRKRRQEAEEAS